MTVVPRGLFGLFAGFAASLTGLAMAALCAFPAQANDPIDALITGSINPAAAPASPEGSAQFRKGLDAVADGNAAEAYALGESLPNGIERRTLQWAAIYFGAGKVDYNSIARFAADAPNFASPSVFKTRLEQSLVKADASGSEVIRLLAGAMPNTLDAQINLAAAYLDAGKKDRAAQIAHDIWGNNFLTPETEAKVKTKLGSLLTRDAHWARAVHLMMHDRAAGVERLLPSLSSGQKSLAIARIAVSRKASNAKSLLDKVDAAFQSHPVFIFSRAQRARQADLYESAIDWLNKAKGDLPDAEVFWYERRALVRELLANGNARLAYKAADGYQQGPEGRLVEAHFHAGWIGLNFLGDAQSAKTHFTKMLAYSTLPDSVTQGQYWLGKSLQKLGDAAGAKAAFSAAAKYGTVYYGLLARAELGLKGVELRGLPAWKESEAAFESNEVVRAIRLLAANGRQAYAVPLLRNFAAGLKEGGDLVLAARLAQAINAHNVAILIADNADRRGMPLDLFSFPKDGLPSDKLAEIDHAAVYAVARQESHFQIDAISGVGARGLMQLMPATAKETAKKLGVDYSPSRLTTDPAYNALLGSTYLAAQLKRFEGSLVLAAAAYNAGGGNANKWIAAYGDPRTDNVDPVVWVELIPFQETRKYVQRVLGNYMVYRMRLGDSGLSITDALRRIPN
jgi:soluble lytic murein transglycosylase